MHDDDEIEQHRHRCEVRYLIRQVVAHPLPAALARLADKAVVGRCERLRADLNEQTKLGSKGKDGKWLKPE